jgi:hypothetical protein
MEEDFEPEPNQHYPENEAQVAAADNQSNEDNNLGAELDEQNFEPELAQDNFDHYHEDPIDNDYAAANDDFDYVDDQQPREGGGLGDMLGDDEEINELDLMQEEQEQQEDDGPI